MMGKAEQLLARLEAGAETQGEIESRDAIKCLLADYAALQERLERAQLNAAEYQKERDAFAERLGVVGQEVPVYRPVKQKFLHDPDNGMWGDCYRACVASLLGLDIDSVPHVCDKGMNEGPGECVAAMNKWLLAEHGLSMFATAYGCDPGVILKHMDDYYSDMFYLLMGTSKDNTNHIVVCKGGSIIHDPSIDKSGIVDRADDGYTWLEILSRQPAQQALHDNRREE